MWSFIIPDHKLTIPFLLVGRTSEPNLFMERTAVNFKTVLVNRKVKEIVKLINQEATTFNFSFSETSFELNADVSPVLYFTPTSGTIGPHSEIPIEINFSPSAEKSFNFNLICNIKRKPTPLSINVKGEGYGVHDALEVELADGSTVELQSGSSAENILDFGLLQVNEKRMKRIHVINAGKYNFDFSWKLPIKQSSNIRIMPEMGTVMRGQRTTCQLLYHPLAVSALKNCKLQCQIANGRSYNLVLIGGSARP